MPIPSEVVEALAEVRESGVCNMLDRHTVIREVFRLADEEDRLDYHKAVVWLSDNKHEYMNALIEMGNMREDR